MDWTILAIVIQLIFLEGILSIDNAAVLGTMVSTLPETEPVPWPPMLRKLGRLLNPLLGNQRMGALRVGILGAYLGRGLMLLVASLVVHNPWLKLIGALYLIRLAAENLGSHAGESDEAAQARKINGHNFWLVVMNVEIADLVFSLDNVVAAVSLSDKLWVVFLGVALGILTMRFAAGFFTYAVVREPILKAAAYVLVLNIGVQLILEDLAKVEINDWVRFAISMTILLGAVVYAHSKILQKLRPVLSWLTRGLGILNDFLTWVISPASLIFMGLFNWLRSLFRRAPANNFSSGSGD